MAPPAHWELDVQMLAVLGAVQHPHQRHPHFGFCWDARLGQGGSLCNLLCDVCHLQSNGDYMLLFCPCFGPEIWWAQAYLSQLIHDHPAVYNKERPNKACSMLWSLDIYVCLSLICSSRVYCIIYLQIHSNCITAYICPSSWLLLIHATAYGASCRATLSLSICNAWTFLPVHGVWCACLVLSSPMCCFNVPFQFLCIQQVWFG